MSNARLWVVVSLVAAISATGLGLAWAAEEAAPVPEATPTAQAAMKRLSREAFALRTREGRAAAGPAAEAAVEAGLNWLAKAQEPDGSWSPKRWGGAEGVETGLTGLALMAFLGAGHTHAEGPFKETVAKGLEWLKTRQGPDGAFQRRSFYEQGIAAIAACEAYGLTQDREIRPLAERGVLFICAQQPPHGGFRYQGGTTLGDGDLSVSGWQMMAMVAGVCAGIETIPPQIVDRARVLLANAYRPDGGSVYTVGGGNTTPSMTAVGLLCRAFLGWPETEAEMRASADYLDAAGRRAGADGEAARPLAKNLYTNYYACLALFQCGGKPWEEWNARYREPLAKAQETLELDQEERFIRGSWDPKGDAFGSGAGRVYATAMAVLCLEAPYRYKRLLPHPPRKAADF